ncbi:sensor domain-containing protein [Halopiger xanaduensis]|uniref:Two-component system sensor kinase n=1 Tax=Halopiger xanaduensis (strain DSM 18323 / JCM 14033 / SH-6) TaxID=797210 RepID=F8D4F6_HALXS|nr:sensor domain-containing protein [Halopiger xanaduensis]AEH38700.1 two-component system sensor kinase [Halopiger xanaduensis SH-6]
MAESERTRRADGASIGDLVRVVVARRTYKNLCYLLLAIPLGMAYYTALLLGLGFGTALVLVGVGIPILIGTVLGTRLFAALERSLANALLEVELRSPDDVRPGPDDGLVASLRRYLDAPSTWRGLAFLMVKSWLGIVGVVLVLLFGTLLSLLTAPLRYPHEVEFGTVNDQPVTWLINTPAELALAVSVGAVLGVAALHVSNGFAYAARRSAVALLDGADPDGDADSVPDPGADSDLDSTEVRSADR